MKRTAPDTASGMNALRGVYILALISMLFWGLSFVWSTIVLKYYTPVTTIFLRLVLSSTLLLGFILIFKRREKIDRSDYKLLFLSALMNPFLYFIGENYGLKLTTPTTTAIIIAIIPVLTPLAAFLALKERLSVMNFVGIFVSFAGIIIMLIKPDLSMDTSLAGLGFLFFAVITAIVYSIMVKKLVDKYRPLTIITAQNIIGLFLFLPLFVAMDWTSFISTEVTFELAASLVQLAVFASSLAFIFFIKVIGRIGVSRANVFSNLIPVFTAIFSFILVGEIFTVAKIAGMAVVLLGVMLSQRGAIKVSA